MFTNLVLSPMTKVLAVTTLLFLATSSLTTWAYLGTRDELAKLEVKYAQLEQVAKECEEAKERNTKSCLQDDALGVASRKEQKSIDDATKSKVKALENLPRKNCINPEKNNHEKDTTNTTEIYVDIDAPFDDEFLSVFGNKD